MPILSHFARRAASSSAIAAQRWIAAVTLVAVAQVTFGCSSGPGAGELAVRPQPQPLRGAATINVPQDKKLTIALSSFSKQPGLSGAVEGDATASADGGGQITAKVTKGGVASGTLQLGHVFENDSDRQVELELAISYHYKLEVQPDAKAGAQDAAITMSIFARGSQNRTVRTLNVASYATDQGMLQRESREGQLMHVTLGPGENVQFFLAATAAIDTAKSERSAACTLKIDQLKIGATPRPAPAVGTASDVGK